MCLNLSELSLNKIWKIIENHWVENDWNRPAVLKENITISKGLNYHLKSNLSIGNSIYRYGSPKYFELMSEVKSLHKNGKIILNSNDQFLVENFSNATITDNGKTYYLNHIYEAEYQGKNVDLNKPKRGGSKKFYVYVKDGDKVKKVSFGAKGGGQKLSVKIDDPKARKAFADRHNCDQKKDKTSPGYWSCNIPRYWKQLGGSKNYNTYW